MNELRIYYDKERELWVANLTNGLLEDNKDLRKLIGQLNEEVNLNTIVKYLKKE